MKPQALFLSAPSALRAGLVAAGILVAAALAAGCGGVPRQPVHLLVGWDTSESARDIRDRSTDLGLRAITQLDPDRDELTLLRMDRHTAEFFRGHPPDSRERLQPILVVELNKPVREPGTHMAEFWQEAAARVKRSKLPTVVVLLTDGGNDDGSAEARGRQRVAVRRLANSSSLLRVSVWGVRPGLREAMQADLQPLGDRLEIRGLDDADPDALFRLLMQNHPNPRR